MSTKQTRIAIAIPEDIEAQIEQLRHTSFCGRSDAEIYREVIRLGLERINGQAGAERHNNAAQG